jgi:hypothetical protein
VVLGQQGQFHLSGAFTAEIHLPKTSHVVKHDFMSRLYFPFHPFNYYHQEAALMVDPFTITMEATMNSNRLVLVDFEADSGRSPFFGFFGTGSSEEEMISRHDTNKTQPLTSRLTQTLFRRRF